MHGQGYYIIIIILHHRYYYIIENIYDEPTSQEPIYQEVAVKPPSPKKIEMTENCSYVTTRTKQDTITILEECPAYIRH